MENWIELKAPDGTWVEFNISGSDPTPEELSRFNDILSKNYPTPEVLATPESMPDGSPPQSLGAPPEEADLNFSAPDRVSDVVTSSTAPTAPEMPVPDGSLTASTTTAQMRGGFGDNIEYNYTSFLNEMGLSDNADARDNFRRYQNRMNANRSLRRQSGSGPEVTDTAPQRPIPPTAITKPEGLLVEPVNESGRATTAPTMIEPSVADASPVVNTDALDKYVRQLIRQSGSYSEDDLLAAGFTEQQIAAHNDAARAGQGVQPPQGDGVSVMYMAPPNTTMYEGFNIGMPDDRIVPGSDAEITAYGVRNAYLDAVDDEGNSRMEDTFFGPAYRDEGGGLKRVPLPDQPGIIPTRLNPLITDEMQADRPADVPFGVTALSGIEDAFRSVTELGAATVDYLREDKDSTFTNYLKDNWPQLSAGNKTDAMVQEGTALALGFFGGTNLARVGTTAISRIFLPALSKVEEVIPIIREVYPTANRLLQFSPSKVAKFAGGELGMAAAMDSETQTILFGQDGILGQDFNILGVDPNNSDAEAILAARQNLLVDAVLFAGIFEGVGRGLSGASNFVWDVSFSTIVSKALQTEDSAKRRVVENIIDELAKVEASSSREAMDQARARIVEVLRQNAEVVVGDDPVTGIARDPLVLDVFSALEKGESLQPQTIARIREMRAGMASRGGSGDLVAAMDGPARTTEDVLDKEVAAAFSEGNNPTVAVGEAVGFQQGRVADAQTAVTDLEAAIQANDNERVAQMLTDPRFGKIVERLGGVSPSEVSAMSEAALQRLGRGVIGEISAINIEKDRLFSLIPEGVPFDYNSFASDVSNAVADRTDFDTAGQALLGNRLVRALKNGMEEAGGIDVGDVANLNIDDAEDFASLMEGAGLDFRRLYTNIRPQISNLADEAFAKGDREVAQRLVGLRSAIDDQVDWVASNSDGEAAQAATTAMDFYRGTVVPLLRDDPLETVDQTVRQNTRRVTGPDGSITVEPRNPNRLLNTVEADVLRIVQEGTGRDVAALQTLLQRQGSDITQEDMEAFLAADIFDQLYSQIRATGLENMNQQQISDLVQRYGVQLRGMGPDSLLAGQLDTFADRIRTMQGGREQLVAELDLAQSSLNNVRDDAIARVINKFVPTISDDLIATENPAMRLRSFVTSADAADNINTLLTATNNNPVILEGLTAAYYESLRDRILGAAETTSGARVFNPSRIRAELNEATGLSGARNVLAQSDPRVGIITDSLLELAGSSAGRNSRAFPAMSGTAELQQYQGAVNRLIYMTIGPLTRGGTQLRAAANFVAEKVDMVGLFNNAAQLVASNASEFADIAEELVRRENTVGIGRMRLDKDLADRLFVLGVRAGIYAQPDVDQGEYQSFWEDPVNWAIDAEKSLTEAARSLTNTGLDTVNRVGDVVFPE